MSDPICVRCARPLADGAYVCDRCAAQTAQKLAEIAEVAPASRDVANGLSRRSHGGASGKPGSRLPLDLTAMAKLDSVQNELTTWARHVVSERGSIPSRTGDDDLVNAALYLAENVGWLRHRQECDDAFRDFEAALRIVRSVARGPAEQRYLGPCGATLCSLCGLDEATHVCEGDIPVWTCDGDVYARDGAQRGRCTTCGAEVGADERRAWLDGEVRAHAFRAAHIGEAYGIKANTIRVWAHRGRLKSYWRTAAGLTVEWVDPVLDPKLEGEAMEKRLGEISDEIQARGGRLHYVGDVLDLAAGDAARREGDRATRARRTAARAAESETAA